MQYHTLGLGDTSTNPIYFLKGHLLLYKSALSSRQWSRKATQRSTILTSARRAKKRLLQISHFKYLIILCSYNLVDLPVLSISSTLFRSYDQQMLPLDLKLIVCAADKVNALNQIRQHLTSEQTPAQQYSNFQQGQNHNTSSMLLMQVQPVAGIIRKDGNSCNKIDWL